MRKQELVVGESYAFGNPDYPSIGVYVGADFPTVYDRSSFSYRGYKSRAAQAVFAVKQWQNEEQRASGELSENRPETVTFARVLMSKADHEAAQAKKVLREAQAKNAAENKESLVRGYNANLGINAMIDIDYRHGGHARGVLVPYGDFVKLAQLAMGSSKEWAEVL